MPTAAPDSELIEQFLAGDCSEQEADQVRAWAGCTPSGAPTADTIRAAVQTLTSRVVDPEVYRQVLRLRLGLGSAVDAELQGKRRAQRERLSGRVPRGELRLGGRTLRGSISPFRIVVVLSVVVVLGLVGIRHRMPMTHALRARVYTTATTQRAILTLPDGSRVQLAPRSVLRVPDDFGHTTRHVMLKGDAYFDVPPSPRVPFVVQTHYAIVRVLGTTFAIEDHAEVAHIAVVTGKVVAIGRTGAVTLTASMVGQVTDSMVRATQVSDLTPYTGWTNGQLVFYDTPVPTMLETVGRWSGYEFRLADTALAQRYVTTRLNIANRAETIIAIQHLLGVSMTFDGSVVTLRPRQRDNSDSPAVRHLSHPLTTTSTHMGR